MCRGGIPPKNCAAVIILALSSSGAKRKYFLTSAQGLLRNVTLKFHLRGWITIPGFPSKEKWNSTGWFCPPPPSPSLGVGIFSAHCRRRCAARDLPDALRAQADVGRENKNHVENPPRKQNLHARKLRERSASRSSRESSGEGR